MNNPEVVLVFGLRRNEGIWRVEWKASHWIESEVEGILPHGVDTAIAEDMMKNKMGDKAFDLTLEGIRKAPEIISKLMSGRR